MSAALSTEEDRWRVGCPSAVTDSGHVPGLNLHGRWFAGCALSARCMRAPCAGRVFFFPINAPGMGRFKLVYLVGSLGYS